MLELAWAAFGDGFGDGAALGLLMGTLGQLGDGVAPASLVISCPLCSALSLASVLQRYVRVAIGRKASGGKKNGVCSVWASRVLLLASVLQTLAQLGRGAFLSLSAIECNYIAKQDR